LERLKKKNLTEYKKLKSIQQKCETKEKQKETASVDFNKSRETATM
jgi:hypothetical protein